MQTNIVQVGKLDASGKRFGIIAATYYEEIVNPMIVSATQTFEAFHTDAVDIWHVPGVFEIPVVAQQVALTYDYEALLTLGCVIRGETKHYDLITDTCSRGIMQAMLQTGVPITLGILAVDDIAHAAERTKPSSEKNRGREYALATLQIAQLISAIEKSDKRKVLGKGDLWGQSGFVDDE